MSVGPADVCAAAGFLEEALGDALLVDVDVEGIAQEAAVGGDEEAAGGSGVEDAAVVLGVELGEEAEFDVCAEFRAVTAETLPEKDGFEVCAGDAGGLGFDVCAEDEEGWAVGLVGDGDEDGGAFRGGAGGGLVVAYGVVGVVLAAAADLGEKELDLRGVYGLVDKGSELALDCLGDAFVGCLDADAEEVAGGAAAASGALEEIRLPLLVGDGVFEELGLVFFGGVVAALG